jgi:hypothetical protein
MDEFDTSADYVAVSYTWKQPPSLEAELGVCLPEYILWTSETEWRRLRCPPLVLHRALRFAYQRQHVPLIWIDQECIDQQDPADLELHLQRMHEIYGWSTYTVAVLSRPVATVDLLDKMVCIAPRVSQGDYTSGGYLGEHPENPQIVLDLLEFLLQDVWFTRTWTLQERRCSQWQALHFLVPVHRDVREQIVQTTDSASSLDAHVPSTQKLPNAILSLNIQPEPSSSDMDYPISAYTFRELATETLACAGTAEVRSVRRLLQKHFMTSKGGLDPEMIFQDMEECDNLVVADRLAIFSNICDLRWRLKQTELDRKGVSYSTCMLLLLKWNWGWGDSKTLSGEVRRLLDYDMASVLRRLTLANEALKNIVHVGPH